MAAGKPRIMVVGQAGTLRVMRRWLAMLGALAVALALAVYQAGAPERRLQGLLDSGDVKAASALAAERLARDPGNAELRALGHVFRTRSDTEVIVHAWEAWGERCVERFRGMFTFALWDANQSVLFLAREYVTRIVAGVPEIKSYLEALAEDREIDNQLALGEDEIPSDERILI